jgi:serine/threonine protein kinase
MVVTPRIGTVFAGYRIEGLKGRGGMSVVYRAENPRLGNVVALKLLAPELAEDESFRERFVRESRTAASMAHPNIVPIYDAGDAEGVLYIAMRYVEGPDLKTIAKDRDQLPPARVLRIGAQVASALDAAHGRGLIHRDVKPANILLEIGAEGDDHVYLADFGLTKHVESYSGITGSGQFVGTIEYMAPEQIEGKQVDARADLYALGCVLYECLAGSPPYRRETEVAVLWAHMRDEPPQLTSVRPDLPEPTDDVLAKALAKDPDERYETSGDFVADLRAALGASVAAPPKAKTVRAPARKRPDEQRGAFWRTRSRWRVPALVSALLAAGAGLAAAVLLTTGWSSTVDQRTATVRTSFLSAMIPPRVLVTCKHSGKLNTNFYESLECHPGNGVQRVVYHLARSPALMHSRFAERLRDEQIRVYQDRFTPSGDCASGEKAAELWVARSRTGGHEPKTTAIPARVLGDVLCHHTSSQAWIEWTDNRRFVYAVAQGPESRFTRLYEWWATQAGPRG